MNNSLYQKRCDLIIDYISQILVYGSNTRGNISIDNYDFEDGKYLILNVSVLKNSYFRWHDLNIKASDKFSFYKLVLKNILDKFKKFNITFSSKMVSISSSVNNNQIDICFTLDTKKEKEWFLNQKDLFYNKDK